MLSRCILEVGRVSERYQETVHSTLKTESRDDLESHGQGKPKAANKGWRSEGGACRAVAVA